MKFALYLKNCRQRYELTQEELVNHLYNFDALFSKLDVGTLSRWERGISSPNIKRKKQIILALRHYSDEIFPAFDLIDMNDLEQKSTLLYMSKIVGEHKRYVLDFPKDLIKNKIIISDMKESDTFKIALKLTHELHKNITNNYSNLTIEHFKVWAAHPKSFFSLATYEGNFFGMFFSLQLNQSTFNKLLSKEMKESEITFHHFSKDTEKSYDYLLGYFAYSQESATLLIIKYYQYLIKQQKYIQKVGSLIKIDSGHALVTSFGLKPSKNKQAYTANIEDILLSPTALALFFEKFIK